MLKAVVVILRSLGVCLIVYIDDILVTGRSPDEVRDHVEVLIALLDGFGWLGLHSEHGEVCDHSIPANWIPGVAGRYDYNVSPWSQDQSNQGRSFSAPLTGQSQCSQVGTILSGS